MLGIAHNDISRRRRKGKAVNEALQLAQQVTEKLNLIISVIEENKPERTT